MNLLELTRQARKRMATFPHWWVILQLLRIAHQRQEMYVVVLRTAFELQVAERRAAQQLKNLPQ
jgi:hypothetical protein